MKSPAQMATIAMGICGILIMLDVGRTYVLQGLAILCLAIALFCRPGGGSGV